LQAGTSGQLRARVTKVMNRDVNAPTIPKLRKPIHVMKQPIATRRPVETGSGAPPVDGMPVSVIRFSGA